MWILYLILGFSINGLIGVILLTAIDDNDMRWYRWLRRNPLGGVRTGIHVWPWWLYLWWKENHK